MSDDDPLVVEGRKPAPDALDWAADRITALARGRLLDVGCGSGRFLAPDAAGVDIDEARLRAARSRARLLAVADAHVLPFADATFDTVLANRMLNDAGRVDVVLAEIARVLRRDGRAIVLTLASAAPSPLRRIHEEARDSLGARRDRGSDRLDDANGADRLARFFSRVERETYERDWRFDDPAAALDHYARRYLHRGERDARAQAALFERVRERVLGWRGELWDQERAVLFIARR